MVRRVGVLLATLGLVACDFPTELPSWEQTWVVPAEEVRISVAELLPTGVGLNPTGTAFRVEVPEIRISTSLGELCPACAALNGQTVPKPEFSVRLTEAASLPEDLVSAVLAGGSLDVTLGHSFSFDPLRPGGGTASRGHMVISIASNGTIVARDSVSGHDHAFPAGSVLARSLPVRAGTVTNRLELEVRIYSPAGGTTMIRTADTLGVAVGAGFVDVAEATLRATGLAAAPTRTPLRFDLDDDLLERIERGALRVAAHNPFNLSGSLVLSFDLGDQSIERTVAVEPGTFSRRLEFTGSEIRDILAAPESELIASGTLSAPGGTVTVTPTQELVMDASFELVVLVGGMDGGA